MVYKIQQGRGALMRVQPNPKMADGLLSMGGYIFFKGSIDSCKCGHIYPWVEKVAGELGGGSSMIDFRPLRGKYPINF